MWVRVSEAVSRGCVVEGIVMAAGDELSGF